MKNEKQKQGLKNLINDNKQYYKYDNLDLSIQMLISNYIDIEVKKSYNNIKAFIDGLQKESDNNPNNPKQAMQNYFNIKKSQLDTMTQEERDKTIKNNILVKQKRHRAN